MKAANVKEALMADHQLPSPNLEGDYRGSCVACFRGTDTGLAFRGEAEWAIAGLVVLGVDQELAKAMVSQAAGKPAGIVPSGVIVVSVRVCSHCAETAGFGVSLIASGELPTYSPNIS